MRTVIRKRKRFAISRIWFYYFFTNVPIPHSLIEILRKMGTNYADLKAALTIARASS